MFEYIRIELKKLLKETTDLGDAINEINDESDLTSLGINSVSFIKLTVRIEEEFGFEFEDEYLDYNKFKTIKDLILYVADKTQTK